MQHLKAALEMLIQVMNLRMAVVAGSNAVTCTGCLDLVEFHLPVSAAFLRIAVLEETATTAAAVVV